MPRSSTRGSRCRTRIKRRGRDFTLCTSHPIFFYTHKIFHRSLPLRFYRKILLRDCDIYPMHSLIAHPNFRCYLSRPITYPAHEPLFPSSLRHNAPIPLHLPYFTTSSDPSFPTYPPRPSLPHFYPLPTRPEHAANMPLFTSRLSCRMKA